ncbi:MAG: glycosyltransferase family 4 protein [Actinomycetota bacterium]|nr:glycosyltransferase family 4 protein [Actinomycetota bacterium]
MTSETVASTRRLLFVAPFVPSRRGRHGASRCLAELLDALSARHSVGLLHLRGRGEPGVEASLTHQLEVVREIDRPEAPRDALGRAALLVSLLRGRPMWAHDWRVAELARQLADLVGDWRPEVVHLDLAVMGQYVSAVPGPTVTVLTDHDPPVPAAVEALRQQAGLRRLLYALDLQAWWRMERIVLRSVATAIVFTEDDRARLARTAGLTPIVTIPLGTTIPSRPLDPLGSSPPTLLFVGGPHHPPNAEAAKRLAERILPRLVERMPDVRLRIVGDYMPGTLKSSAAAHLVVSGAVADVRPFLDEAAVVVAPLTSGGGMRVKVMEALAAGKAVVGTSLAFAGLDAPTERAAVVAEADDEFCVAIAGLLRDPAERAAVAARARRWATENLTWSRRVAQYEQLYDRLLPAASPVRSEEPKA